MEPPASSAAPTVVTAPTWRRAVYGPIALVFGVLFLTPFWYAVDKGDWTAPGDGSVGTSVVGYLIAGALALLMLSTVPFLFRFRVEIWPDRMRKRILFGFSELRLADARHIVITPERRFPRWVAEKWLVTGTSTRGRRFRVTIDKSLVSDPAGYDALGEWIRRRPDLEPSLFGRTSSDLHRFQSVQGGTLDDLGTAPAPAVPVEGEPPHR